MTPLRNLRNIGISAHIDSGKTTLSERILYYTGRIHKMGEVRGEGATMDSRQDETDRGITIESAATSCTWNDIRINLIDTPGHVDFTIEVERALRVLDGAVMVLCAVAGVQAQSITVDRQMKRYGVPRIAFINKMDREGADPFRVVQGLRDRLNLNPVVLQLPMGLAGDVDGNLENHFSGVIDLVTMQAHSYAGEQGENRIAQPIPAELRAAAEEAREKMLDQLSLFSDELLTLLLEDNEVPAELIWATVRQATLQREIVPVLMGSAYKNKGVQDLLDAVKRYLPSPLDRGAITAAREDGETVAIAPNPDTELVALAFKLTVENFGQLTYVRVYSGRLKPGDTLHNSRTRERLQVSRIVRMHAAKRETINQAQAGDIVALLGVDCASGDTLCGQSKGGQSEAGKPQAIALEAMFVPDAVITRAIAPKSQADGDRMAKALNRFCKEDPTFRVSVDAESGQTLISGMGELHLDIYLDRMREEYKAEVEVGNPAVAYREAIAGTATFDYRFKKQSGGPGQFAHVVGRVEPLAAGDESVESEDGFAFENRIVGGAIPREFISSCEKGFRDALLNGPLEGYPLTGVRVILEGGSYHAVDSSEQSFRMAAKLAIDEAVAQATPQLLEPIMAVEVETPHDHVGRVQGDVSARRGLLLGSEAQDDYTVIRAEVPLAQMFGYSTSLRSLTAGMASYAMEFAAYRPVPGNRIEG